MKKFFVIAVVTLMLSSCTFFDRQEVTALQAEKAELNSQISQSRSDVTTYTLQAETLKAEVEQLKLSTKALKVEAGGKAPKYVLGLRLKQSHMSLSISQHIKDSINAIDFTLPVDKEFFDTVKVGDSVVDSFRIGSWIMEGSWGNWEMFVTSKDVL